MNLNSNKLPKGIITLDYLPNDQERSRGLNLAANKDDHIPVAIVEGKVLNLGKVRSKAKQEFFFIYVKNSMMYLHGHMMI